MTTLSGIEYFVCGGFGGMCTVLLAHPFDTIKVRLQTEGGRYKGMMDCINNVIEHEGYRGLYKGMQVPLVNVTPLFALSYLGFTVGASIMDANHPDADLLNIFVAGGVAGIFSTIMMAPGERIKCLLQMQKSNTNKKYNGMVDCAVKLYREGGVSSLYRGTLATLIRDIPSSGVYFMTYRGLTRYLSSPGEKLGLGPTICAGGISGVLKRAVGMPADVLKTRIQSAPPGRYPGGITQVLTELIQNEGILNLFRGIVPMMLRTFPANAACFVGFEFCAEVMTWF